MIIECQVRFQEIEYVRQEQQYEGCRVANFRLPSLMSNDLSRRERATG